MKYCYRQKVGGGTLFLEDGALITKNTHSVNWIADGVYVTGGGVFTMSDMTAISDNKAFRGGVNVTNGGTFTMNGKTLAGNKAGNGGG